MHLGRFFTSTTRPSRPVPTHPARLAELRHIHNLLVKSGVQVVFNGHEHNLQLSERNDHTGGIQYIVSGSGGSLRTGKVSGAEMRAANIAGWAPQRQFLVVDIRDREMTITPMGNTFPSSYRP